MTVPETEVLMKILDESPFLTSEERKNFGKEVQDLSEKVKEGKMTFLQLEKAAAEINKKAALKEIENLISKIGLINPSSPRPESLRKVMGQLKRDEISPDDARTEIEKMMLG